MYRIQFPEGMTVDEKTASLVDGFARMWLDGVAEELPAVNSELDPEDKLTLSEAVDDWLDWEGEKCGFLESQILGRMKALAECPD